MMSENHHCLYRLLRQLHGMFVWMLVAAAHQKREAVCQKINDDCYNEDSLYNNDLFPVVNF